MHSQDYLTSRLINFGNWYMDTEASEHMCNEENVQDNEWKTSNQKN